MTNRAENQGKNVGKCISYFDFFFICHLKFFKCINLWKSCRKLAKRDKKAKKNKKKTFFNVFFSEMSLSLSLGRSQETDSECESIRSDTRTIRSPDSDSGHHRQSLTSRSPDSDTGHHSDTTHHRQSTATRDELSSDSADSSDFSQKNEVRKNYHGSIKKIKNWENLYCSHH